MSACKNIEVTNVQGLENAYAGTKYVYCSIGVNDWKIKTMAQTAISMNVQNGLFLEYIEEIYTFILILLPNLMVSGPWENSLPKFL